MRETIRRIRKRKTWVNPTAWRELWKGKWIILTAGFYLLSLISAVSRISFIFLGIGVVMTLVYSKVQMQLKNRFKHIEEKFRTRQEDKNK